MKKVTILYTQSKLPIPLFSWAVQLFTWNRISHVAIQVQLPGWEPVIYQASQKMTNLMSMEVFNKRHKVLNTHDLLVPSNLYNNMIHRMSQQLGKPYAMLQNIGIGISIMASWLGIKMKNPWKGGVNCSELVYTELLQPMLGSECSADPQLVTPEDIKKIVEDKCQKNLLPVRS